MVSIIICSRDAQDLAAVSHSIAATIGVIYELISIDNSTGSYGICEAYNIGAKRARYDMLCFMHEDIRFRSTGWGQHVVDILADSTIGVLGVTGGLYQLEAPAPWWGCGLELCRENVLNIFEDGHTEMELRNPEQQLLTDVAVVDGMWMCSRREVWQKHPFDANTFADFHFYDVDYCTEIFLRGYRICVTFEVLLEHHSRGSLNDSWLRNALRYQNKRNGQLPFGTAKPTELTRRKLELRALQEFTGRLIRAHFPAKLVMTYLGKCLRLGIVNRDNWWLAKKWLYNSDNK